jgi:prepilin-type N-terminal cleavage/methylation domain-containing protein
MLKQKYMKQTKNKGFTLIELLVVIAIISLLSTIILASVNVARVKAKDAKALAEYGQLKIALEMFYNEYGRYPLTDNNIYYGNMYCLSGECTLAGSGAIIDSFPYQSAFEYRIKDSNIAYSQSMLDQLAGVFNYKPSTEIELGGNKGFIYSVPNLSTSPNELPRIIFPLVGSNRVVETKVGVWQIYNATTTNN